VTIGILRALWFALANRFSQPSTSSSERRSVKPARARMLLAAVAVMGAMFALPMTAQAQQVTGRSVSPSTYSLVGDQITFSFTFNSGGYTVQSVTVQSAIGASYSCSGFDTTDTNQNGT
jgi:hypothetical protein